MEEFACREKGGDRMARTVGIGIQDYEKARRENLFLVDKTMFIKEWWENHDEVTLLTRPRRFGKLSLIHISEPTRP